MIICRHRKTGCVGIVRSRLDATEDFPAQLGIYWNIVYNKQIPNHYFWNNADDIEIIEQ